MVSVNETGSRLEGARELQGPLSGSCSLGSTLLPFQIPRADPASRGFFYSGPHSGRYQVPAWAARKETPAGYITRFGRPVVDTANGRRHGNMVRQDP